MDRSRRRERFERTRIIDVMLRRTCRIVLLCGCHISSGAPLHVPSRLLHGHKISRLLESGCDEGRQRRERDAQADLALGVL